MPRVVVQVRRGEGASQTIDRVELQAASTNVDELLDQAVFLERVIVLQVLGHVLVLQGQVVRAADATDARLENIRRETRDRLLDILPLQQDVLEQQPCSDVSRPARVTTSYAGHTTMLA